MPTDFARYRHPRFRAERFSLGIDLETGRPYLSTPVHGSMHAVEYEACFAISDEEYRCFLADPASADTFVEDYAMGRQDVRRIA